MTYPAIYKPILKSIRLVLLYSCIAASAYAGDSIKPFTTDGCSLFPDGLLNNKDLWLSCCTAHDMAYWQGGTWQQRLNADRQLKHCVGALGEPAIAELMLNGVRLGGSPFWPTYFRWGYGWHYLRGYKPLNESEKQAVQEALQDYQALNRKPPEIK